MKMAITRSHFTLVKSAAIIVVIAMIAAVTAQATVTNIGQDQIGFWSDSASSKAEGVSFHALVESDKKVYEDRSITLCPVCDKDKSWTASDPVIDDDVLVSCQGSKNKGSDSAEEFDEFILSQDLSEKQSSKKDDKKDAKYSDTALLSDEYGYKKDKKGDYNADISAEEITLNIVGQFSNGDSSKASFSQIDMGKGFAKGSGHGVGFDDSDNLKVVLKSCGEDYGIDRSTQFAYDCYDRGNRGKKDGHHQSGDGGCGSNPEVPEPSTLAIFAIASLCFLVKKRSQLTSRF